MEIVNNIRRFRMLTKGFAKRWADPKDRRLLTALIGVSVFVVYSAATGFLENRNEKKMARAEVVQTIASPKITVGGDSRGGRQQKIVTVKVDPSGNAIAVQEASNGVRHAVSLMKFTAMTIDGRAVAALVPVAVDIEKQPTGAAGPGVAENK